MRLPDHRTQAAPRRTGARIAILETGGDIAHASAFVEREAVKRGVEGWARNRKDGSVEAVLAGPPDAVEAVIEACRRGPFNARVDAIDQRDGTDGEFSLRHSGELFSVLRDA